MNHTAHIIRRQNVQLRVSRSGNALALQQRFLRMMEEQVLPKLEQIFNRMAGPDEWIEIDRLDVHIGRLEPGVQEEVWVEKIIRAYTDALEKQLPKAATRRNAPAAQQGELLLYFLEHGILPWWAAGQKLEEAILAQLPDIAARLPSRLNTPNARRRWVCRFDDALQMKTFDIVAKKIFSGQNSGAILSITLEGWQRWFPDAPRTALRHAYWESVWEALQTPEVFFRNWPPALLKRALSFLPDGWASRLAILEKGINAETFTQWPKAFRDAWMQTGWALVRDALFSLPQQNRRAAAKEITLALRRFARQWPDQKALIEAVNEEMTSSKPAQRPEYFKEDMAQTPSAQSKTTAPLTEPDGIFVPLAGIVLLHPFLPAFFEQNGLLHEGRFNDAASQERAVHLLYHATTGLQHPAEEELPLLKILCGMPIDTPIERILELSEKERTETLQMLEAMTEHWQAIAGISPDDLRGSFFIREGKLRRGDLGLYLTVEEKTLDILLTTLPWGLSPILHTWMPEMIWVEWG